MCSPSSLFQACAPRYIYYVFMNRMDPVGVCFTARDNFEKFTTYRPCVELGTRAAARHARLMFPLPR